MTDDERAQLADDRMLAAWLYHYHRRALAPHQRNVVTDSHNCLLFASLGGSCAPLAEPMRAKLHAIRDAALARDPYPKRTPTRRKP